MKLALSLENLLNYNTLKIEIQVIWKKMGVQIIVKLLKISQKINHWWMMKKKCKYSGRRSEIPPEWIMIGNCNFQKIQKREQRIKNLISSKMVKLHQGGSIYLIIASYWYHWVDSEREISTCKIKMKYIFSGTVESIRKYEMCMWVSTRIP